ncbi:MAG TPA: symmetrical bis(5'-nucleosyl)-tetraphosphatase [Rhodocyclaceae bacterium]|nr:symmetrical bis(5'-nucleosyl)-tetraphosphatase [Rhodocyclaceae bacterium]
MATYVVGDLQGCLASLTELLTRMQFDAAKDRLWFVGDLVNRGPQSLDTLRFVSKLGDTTRVVLGNHDLYLLALAAGVPPKNNPGDTLQEVLDAPDATALIDWLRTRPLFYVEDDFAMVHAGLLPQWSISQARALAAEVETELRGPHWQAFLRQLLGNKPNAWEQDLTGWDRFRVVINAMTRMRMMTPDGRMEMKAKGPPSAAPAGLMPWFEAPDAAWRTHTILCGHWSALGFRDAGQVIALDSGCVWGGSLTAMRLDDRAIFEVKCPQYARSSNGD